jgi:hypothetical protein
LIDANCDVVDPWEHVIGMGLGVVFVNQLLKWEAQVEQDLDKMLAKAKAANERRYIGSFLFAFRFLICSIVMLYYVLMLLLP